MKNFSRALGLLFYFRSLAALRRRGTTTSPPKMSPGITLPADMTYSPALPIRNPGLKHLQMAEDPLHRIHGRHFHYKKAAAGLAGNSWSRHSRGGGRRCATSSSLTVPIFLTICIRMACATTRIMKVRFTFLSAKAIGFVPEENTPIAGSPPRRAAPGRDNRVQSSGGITLTRLPLDQCRLARTDHRHRQRQSQPRWLSERR